jgi:hypothetical protein
MEHPFVNNLDDKSLDELQNTISDLSKKLNFAYRSSNGPMIQQLMMALESYKNAYGKKINEMIEKQKINMQIKVDKK